MVNKFSKTIFTIVFVVFLGLSFFIVDNVFAANFTCKAGNYTLEYNTNGEIQSVKDSSGANVDKYLESYFYPKSANDCPDKKGYTVEVSRADGGRTLIISSPKVVCTIDGYTLSYSTSGELQSAKNSSGEKVDKYLESYFAPTSQNQCPDKTGYNVDVKIIDGGRTLYVSSETISCELNGYTIIYKKNGEIQSASKGGSKIDKYYESYFKPTSPSACPTSDKAKIYFIDGGRTFYVGKIDETFQSNGGNGNTGSTNPGDQTDAEYGKDIGKLERGNSTVGCGTITDIPKAVPTTISIIYIIIQILVPIGLIIFGMIDVAKAVSAQKEDEIKKGQQTFIKRLIAAAIIFFVFSVVKLVISFLSDSADVTDCMNCFIDNNCKPGYDAETGTDYTPEAEEES